MTKLARTGPLLARLAGDTRAISSVEFALILPLMLLIYAGSVELSEALTVDRKVNRVASTVGDLVAQADSMSSAEITNIFNASTAIMEPYGTGALTIQVMAIDVTATAETVNWAEARNDTDPANGSNSPIDIPADVASPGSQVIVARATYSYTSPFSDVMAAITGHSSYEFEHVFMMSPRLGTAVPWKS